jgi:hypothetical protein
MKITIHKRIYFWYRVMRCQLSHAHQTVEIHNEDDEIFAKASHKLGKYRGCKKCDIWRKV